MTPDALTRPPRTKAEAAADMRERARKLRARAVLQPDYVAVVFRSAQFAQVGISRHNLHKSEYLSASATTISVPAKAEADRLDRMAAELEDEG